MANVDVTIYKTETGEVALTGNLPQNELEYMIPEGHSYILGCYDDSKYIIVDGKPVEYKREKPESVLWAKMRAERDRRLASTDWTILPDSPPNTTKWKEYRKKLRELPENIQDIRNFEWPEKPE